MSRYAKQSRYLLILLLLFEIQPKGINGQQVSYKIHEDNIDISNESVKPYRQIKSVTDHSIEITYTFPGFSVSDIAVEEDIYQIVRIDGFGLSLNTGRPSLPLRTEKIALPSNTEPNLSVIASEYIEVDGYNIFPAQEMTTDNAVEKLGFRKNLNTYTSDKFFPKNLATVEDIQIYRSFPLAYIHIHPVQYNPFRKKLRIYKSLTVRVEYKPSGSSVTPKINSNSVSNYSILNNTVINPAVFNKNIIKAKAAKTIPIGYIIVTTPEFDAAANSLANWKRQLGYKVEILSQNSWSVSQIKSAVENLYNTMSPTPSYFVILGDQEDVPDYYYENNYLTPMLPVYSTNYYACMDGPNDYIPEMAHGRISVNSGNQAVKVIQKIIDFEKNPPSDPTFYSKGMQAGYFQDSTRDGTSEKRYAHTSIEIYEYLKNQGYQSDLILYTEPDVKPKRFNSYYSGNTTIPAQYLKENGFAWDGDKYDILNSLNDGRIYAFHRDHGTSRGWVSPQFDINDLDGLTNGNETPIVFSINCASGLFTKSEPFVCFAEKLLRYENGGAVGIVAATEETRSGYNDGLMMGMIDAIWPNPGLIPDLGDGGETVPVSAPHEPIYTMGDVLIQGLIRMTENWDPTGWADRDQFHLYHYFGDPAMQFWTDVPASIWANHTNSINTSTTSINISGSNCSDGLATVCAGNELLASERLSGGTGSIELPGPLGKNNSEIILTISKHNYIPYVAKLPVSGANLPDIPKSASNLTAQLAGSTKIQLTWIDNADNETSYELERSVNSGTFTALVTLPQNSQSYNDLINQQGVTYTYRLKAINSNGSSDYAYSSSLFVPSGGAEKVAGYDEIFSTKVYNDNRRAQNVTMPEDGTVAKINMYHGGGGGSLLYAIYSDAGNKPGNLLAKTSRTSLNSVEGWQEVELETPVFVSANTTIWLAWVYEFGPAIYYTSGGPGRAHSSDTWSAKMPSIFGSSSVSAYTYSIYAIYTTSVADQVPAAPAVLNYNYDENVPMIHLGWLDKSDNEEGFILEREVNDGNYEKLATLSANKTEYTDYSIEHNRKYRYRICAVNSIGSSEFSNEIEINTDFNPVLNPPVSPGNLKAQVYNSNSIQITWADQSNNEDGFVLSRSINNGSYSTIAWINADLTMYQDKIPLIDATYKYRLAAYNNAGSSIPVYSEAVYVPIPDPSEDAIVGYNEVFSTPVYNDYRRAQCVEMPENGTLLTISMYHGGGRGSVLYAVYSDKSGQPGNRLAMTEIVSANSSEGWQEVDLESSIYIEKGKKIWLAWVYQYSPRLFYSSGGLGRAHSNEKWSSKMPLTFGSSSVSDYSYSIYAVYQTEGGQNLSAPATPSSLTTSLKIEIPEVTISWTDNATNEDGFILERSKENNSFMLVSTLAKNETVYHDYDVEYLVGYSYRVYGFNAFGDSPFSNIAEVYISNTSSDPVTVGNPAILPMKVSSCNRRAQQVTIPENGSVESITMYHGPGIGNLLFGIYGDNSNTPGGLLATTPVTPNNPILGWQTVKLTNPLNVSGGQKVWLAWVFTDGTELYYDNGIPGRANSGEFWRGELPNPFGKATFSNYIYSIYLTMYPGAIPKSSEIETNKFNSNAELIVYPEPVSENAFYYSLLNISEAGLYKLELLDITGRMILNNEVWIEPGVENMVQFSMPIERSLIILRIFNEKYTHIKKIALSN